MKLASLSDNIVYNESKPAIQLLFETETTKEIRIAFKKGQVMKEHQTPYPITVEIFEGEINFGVNGEKRLLKKGSMIALAGSVPHDLESTQDSIVRLSLSKSDKIDRVKNLV